MDRGKIPTTPLVVWVAGGIRLEAHVDHDGHVYLHSIRPVDLSDGNSLWELPADTYPSLPLVDVRLAGEGSQFRTSKRQIQGYYSQRLRYESHSETDLGKQKALEIVTRDAATDTRVTTKFTVFGTAPVLRSEVRVKNEGSRDVVLQAVPAIVYGGLALSSTTWSKDWRLHFAHNAWFREVQWHEHSLPASGLDYMAVKTSSRANFAMSNQGSFSTGGYLPMGGISHVSGTASYVWQIEHNGSWRWEIGDYDDGIYLSAGGPTDQDHAWSKSLPPGGTFEGVAAALAVVSGPFTSTFGPLTEYRRLMRRQHDDNKSLPIIFNDYMNCLMGDPTASAVEALIAPAAKCGAEIFVIDCGWYSDDDGWWETVGEWLPSKRRFSDGLAVTTAKIRSAGMIPGLWIEPEVVGIRCPSIDTELPAEAFFQRHGQRVIEQGRYQLDYRHPAVLARMDAVIDRLVRDLGIGYFKFDYNIDITQGTDVDCLSPGDGLFEHNRAYLRWVNGLFDRYPDLIIESCSSGGQRMDYAMLGTHSLQSTSDQQDPVLYASIAAAAPTAVCPEQSASWAYPQPEWSDEMNALTVVNSLMGRVHLSGHLGKLSEGHLRLVADGMAVYKSIRNDLKTAVPFWPLGLPRWMSDWQVLGMDAGDRVFLAVWMTRQREGGQDPVTGAEVAQCELVIERLASATCDVKCIYPVQLPSACNWDRERGAVTVTLPDVQSARLFVVTPSK